MAYRTAAIIVLLHVFSVALLSQGPDARSTATAATLAAQQDHERKEPTSPVPPALSAPQPIQPQPLPETPQQQKGNIVGTVTDVNGGTVANASVVLEGPTPSAHRTVMTNDRGFFEFSDLEPGTYRVTVSAKGFANWTSSAITLNPGQAVILTGSKLKVAEAKATVTVSSAQIAEEQVRIEEKQRVFGIIPNFYVVYEPNAEPLTTKLKFRLALRTAIDPITFIGAGIVAGIYQAADYPDFVQGLKGYGQRFGSVYADGLIDIMIGGAILPSLLHQDPRYFYQGTGTKKSRTFHALSYPFICKGDNGHLQPNYSSMGGDLATAAIANAYYPPANRGVEQVFASFLIGTGERMGASLAQEFILRKLTKVKTTRKDRTHK